MFWQNPLINPVLKLVILVRNAFDIAEKHLGIPRLLDPEDIDTARYLGSDLDVDVNFVDINRIINVDCKR